MGQRKNLPDLTSCGMSPYSRHRTWEARTLGQALAKQGVVCSSRKVPAVATQSIYPIGTTAAERVNLGWWPYPITQRFFSLDTAKVFFAAVGCACSADSSIHYAAALERMAASGPSNAAKRLLRKLPHGRDIYDEFRPITTRPQRHSMGLRPREDIRGVNNLLSEWDSALLAAIATECLDLNRFRLPCGTMTIVRKYGRICPRQCKGGARTAWSTRCATQPGCGIRVPGCGILETVCEVKTLAATENHVRAYREPKTSVGVPCLLRIKEQSRRTQHQVVRSFGMPGALPNLTSEPIAVAKFVFGPKMELANVREQVGRKSCYTSRSYAL